MAEFTSEEEYNLLSGNDVFYADTTLVCATSVATQPYWTFKEVQTDNYVSQSSTSWDSTTGNYNTTRILHVYCNRRIYLHSSYIQP